MASEADEPAWSADGGGSRTAAGAGGYREIIATRPSGYHLPRAALSWAVRDRDEEDRVVQSIQFVGSAEPHDPTDLSRSHGLSATDPEVARAVHGIRLHVSFGVVWCRLVSSRPRVCHPVVSKM